MNAPQPVGYAPDFLGVSAPMLSQLASGQRAKIANPAVLVRLQALRAAAWTLACERFLPEAVVQPLVTRIASSHGQDLT